MPRPRRTYAVLAIVMVASFALSGVGARNHQHDVKYWLGAIGWTIFCLTAVVTIAVSVFYGARALRRRSRTGAAA